MRLRTPLPPIHAESWLNGRPEDLREGAPLLVHFFAIGCEACKQQLPEISHWVHTYGPRGLQFLAVHTPVTATPEGVDDEDVQRAADEHALHHPVAVDHDGHTAMNFELKATPAYFLYDHHGLLRHYHSGYGAVEPTTRAIQRVMGEYEAEQAASAPVPSA